MKEILEKFEEIIKGKNYLSDMRKRQFRNLLLSSLGRMKNEAFHELQLKFIVKVKNDNRIVAAFRTANDASEYLKKVGIDYELKETY